MMLVTAINGCTYCTWFHAQNAVSSEHELPGLLYAQHYAETNRQPDPEVTARFEAFYDAQTAQHILLMIRVIFFGNLLGNMFDAFAVRLKGQKAANSSAVFEALFSRATFWFMLPASWILRRRRADNPLPSESGENNASRHSD